MATNNFDVADDIGTSTFELVVDIDIYTLATSIFDVVDEIVNSTSATSNFEDKKDIAMGMAGLLEQMANPTSMSMVGAGYEVHKTQNGSDHGIPLGDFLRGHMKKYR